jgi:phosphoglycolate phosphatase
MLMARSARVAAIGVAWGYHAPAELLASGALSVAETVAALLQAMEEALA